MPLPLTIHVVAVPGDPLAPPPAQKTWDSYLYAPGEPRVQFETRPDVIEAIAFLRRILGEDWPGFASHAPLANSMTTAFQGAPPECVRLHRLLKPLVDQGHRAVVDVIRLQLGRHGTDFVHGMTVLELAAEAARRGLPLAVAPPGGTGTMADLDVAGVRIEVTCPTSLDETRSRWASVHREFERRVKVLGLDPNDVDVRTDGDPGPDWEALVEKLVDAARHVRFSIAPIALSDPTYDAVVYLARGAGKGCFVFPSPTPFARTVYFAVKRKRPQLRGFEGPRLVLVRVDRLVGTPDHADEFGALADMLAPRFREWTDVSGCLVLSDGFSATAGSRSIKHRWYRANFMATAGGLLRTVAFFPNEAARWSPTADQLRHLMGDGNIFDDREISARL